MFVRINQAMASSLAKREDKEKGFTLIELLVVVLIIGILAAIAIPVYIGQQKTAQDAAAKSNVANAKLAVVAYYAANPSSASAVVTPSSLASFGWPQSSAPAVTVAASPNNTYTLFSVCAVSQGGEHVYKATQATDVVESNATTC